MVARSEYRNLAAVAIRWIGEIAFPLCDTRCFPIIAPFLVPRNPFNGAPRSFSVLGKIFLSTFRVHGRDRDPSIVFSAINPRLSHPKHLHRPIGIRWGEEMDG